VLLREVTHDVFLPWLYFEYAVVAATALCQAHTCPLLRKERNFNARQGLTDQRGNKILSCFGNERNGQETHVSQLRNTEEEISDQEI
jgi:hypothetical protein